MKARQDPNKCRVCGARRGHLTRFSLVNTYSWATDTAKGPDIHTDYAPAVRVVLTDGRCQRCRAVAEENQSGKPGK